MAVKLHEVERDGGDRRKVPAELLAAWRAEIQTLADELQKTRAISRLEADETRFCRWAGQSPDGRRWARNNQDEQQEPFEGATDARVRAVDQVLNERKMMKVLAALRATIKARPMGQDDERRAARVEALLRWLISNKWGSAYVVEMSRLADFVEGDEPAAALCGVYWRREWGLRYEETTIDGLMERYVEWVEEQFAGDDLGLEGAMAEAAAQGEALRAALEDDLREDEAAQWIETLFPYVSEARARKVARDLRRTGMARFPLRYVRRNEPELVAHRLFEDAFVPVQTRAFERTPHYFVTELLTRSELLARPGTDGWNERWVRELAGEPGADASAAPGQEGQVFLPQFHRLRNGRDVAPDDYRQLFQVVHVHFQATNEDGVPGCYVATFHPNIEGTAYGRRMEDYPHGGYPGVLFVRECISNRLLDSRSVSEISGATQGLMKLAHDTTGNVAQFALPPVISIGRATAGRARLAPMEENRLSRNGELKFMQPPSSTGSFQVNTWMDRLEGALDNYWGRPTERTPAQVAALHQEYEMTLWLAQLRDVMRMVVQYCQRWMSPEELARVTDEDGRAVIESRDDIAGEYDVELSFEPRDLDLEFLEQKANLYGLILNSLDQRQTVERSFVVSRLMYAVDGSLASVAVQDVTRADEKERKDEELNFLKLAAGLPVEMAEEGQNFELRLQVLTGIAEREPAAVQGLPPERQEAYLKRVEHLEFMVKQVTENAQAGRVGVKE
jgi:hypothetical protein